MVLPMSWADTSLATRWGWDGDTQRAHLARYREAREANPAGFAQHIAAIFQGREFPPRTDPDTQLYDRFFERADKSQFATVRQTPPDELATRSFVFHDPRLPELLFRYRARNYPDTLSAAEQARWREHCALQLREGPFNWRAFDQELATVRSEPLTPRQAEALEALEHYRRELAQHLHGDS
jgi:exodeoxyribonuclease-1